MNLSTARDKLQHRVTELQACCSTRSPWVFLGASAFIEYLSNLSGTDYKKFVSTWLSQIRPEYSSFRYQSGTSDLPDQMYYVLRCGIVHSLSLVPNDRARSHGGRERSIVLCHRQPGAVHLSSVSKGSISDAALFVAEDFVEDLAKVLGKVFDRVASDVDLERSMSSWLQKHPFISAGL